MALLARISGTVLHLSNNCYSILISNGSKTKLYKKSSLMILPYKRYFCNVRFLHIGSTKKKAKESEYVMYDKVIVERRLEAQRSVIIEVQSEKSCCDVYTYCTQFGKINGMFHYTTPATERHFILIEFEQKENVDTVLSASTHVNHEQIIPVQSNMLWFRNIKSPIQKKLSVDLNGLPFFKHSCKVLNNMDVFKVLITAESVSDQIMLLYDTTKLNDVGVRLRFHTAYQIERNFHGLFPNIAVLPFGSSVNGFGKQGCDLDLTVALESEKMEKSTSRLVFQTKTLLLHEKLQMKKLMSIMADTMNVFIPGICNVRKILEARVPIIKFDHLLTGIECDLAMTNMSGYYMSELLYMYGEFDWRVRPLTFTVRKWAQSLKLVTKNIPGPWITNFSLSLMVIFFLQHKRILPPLNLLKSQATKEDVRIADICIDCTFIRNINKLSINDRNTNKESLEALLINFFTYYGNFDFETKAISIREGKPISKPEYAALYIANPLETSLNVSKNVKFEELERIRMAMRSASWCLEASEDQKAEHWGLVSLFQDTGVFKMEIKSNEQSNKPISKSINIEALFQNDEVSQSTRKRLNEVKKKQRRSKINRY